MNIITFYDRNFISKFTETLRRCHNGVLVLIDADEPSPFRKTSADLITVAGSAKSTIHIDSLWIDIQTFDTFL